MGRFNGGVDQPVGVIGKVQDSGFGKVGHEKITQQVNLLWTVRMSTTGGCVCGDIADPRVLWMGAEAVHSDDPRREGQPSKTRHSHT